MNPLTTHSLNIRAVNDSDAAQIANIYNYYIENTIVTFEEEAVTAQEISQRIDEAIDAKLPYMVAESNQQILGYAYASKWKGRCAYRFAVEVTVYLAKSATGQGVGSQLYTQLFSALRDQSYHIAIAGISLPNPASIALHEKFGMAKAGHFSEVGYKFGNWVDVGYWQCHL